PGRRIRGNSTASISTISFAPRSSATLAATQKHNIVLIAGAALYRLERPWLQEVRRSGPRAQSALAQFPRRQPRAYREAPATHFPGEIVGTGCNPNPEANRRKWGLYRGWPRIKLPACRAQAPAARRAVRAVRGPQRPS